MNAVHWWLQEFRVPPVRPVLAARTPAEVGAGSADQSFQISGLDVQEMKANVKICCCFTAEPDPSSCSGTSQLTAGSSRTGPKQTHSARRQVSTAACFRMTQKKTHPPKKSI